MSRRNSEPASGALYDQLPRLSAWVRLAVKAAPLAPVSGRAGRLGATGRRSRMRIASFPAIIPLGIITMIFCLYFEVASPWFVYDPPLLVPILNVIFLSLISFYISHISARTYLSSGKPTMVFMGCGALAVGLATLAAGWSTASENAKDLSVTIHNSGFFLGGLFHFAGAGFTLLETQEEQRPDLRKRNLTLAYAGVIALIFLSLFFNMDRSLPLFFNPLAGPTPFRQLMLGWAIVLFALSSLFFLVASYRLKTAFLYWYGLGLVLISSGLLALFLVFVVGSPIAWAGRIALYTGGIYLLIAVSKAVIAAHSRNVPLERIVTGLLRKPRALYESLVAATTDAIISLDAKGRVLLWNAAAERIFGYRPDEVLGVNVSDLIIPKEHAGALEDALEGRLPANTTIEVDAGRKGGEELPVEISLSKTKVEREWIATLIVRDIHDRKRTERELLESEKRYRTLFEEMRQSMEALALERSLLNAVLEQMPAGVIIADAESGKPILGNKKAEALWMEGFREDKVEEWPLTKSIRDGEVVLEKEVSFSRKNGTTAIMSANSAPVFDDRNKIIAGVVTFHDITTRKEMEDELRKSRHELKLRVRERTAELERKNKELQDFAFIASHDLHEPLRKIQTFGDLLVRKFERFPDELARDYVSRMQKAAARMELLLDSLLSYSRLNSKVQSFSQINLSDAVRDAVSNLEIRIKETGGSVEVEALPTLEADSSQISQVFQNLIGNALKFQRKTEEPRVRIYSRPVEDSGSSAHEICVEDNGIGFDEKYLDRIFMPFQRLHGRSEYNGVGMGLAICKKIVERHGGAITAKSTEGKGSTFIFTLPNVQVNTGLICQ